MNLETRGQQMGAIILIAIGVMFLLGPLSINWGAIFVGIIGVAIGWPVYQSYRRSGRVESNQMVQGGLGAFLIILAGMMLLNISFSFIWDLWPLALIAVGLAMLFGRRIED